ncbi:uncharacterized protein LOC134722912 [Mytilus trossulus]|uniref:uncharacterized protein LOC134722912 n=1 Tax=Mytilus trossulus TaxID=6551 RepID=UPI003003EDD0
MEVKLSDESVSCDKNVVLDKWKCEFSNMLNRKNHNNVEYIHSNENVYDDYLDSFISYEEVYNVLLSSKNGKSPGCDEITVELYKNQTALLALTRISNICFDSDEVKKLDIGVKIDDEKICVLLYADDLVFITENEKDLQKMLDTLNIWCCKNDLVVNLEKSKIVHFRTKSIPKTNFTFVLNNNDMEIVPCYTYLGLLLSEFLDYNCMAKAVAKSAKSM